MGFTHWTFDLRELAAAAGVACSAGLLASAGAGAAATITFTHAATASSGTLAGVPFGPTAFVITATADTDDRENFTEGFSLSHQVASIDLDGIGTFDFITPTRTFVNNHTTGVGFSRLADLVNGPFLPAFSDYDLLSSIGPVQGDGELLQWADEDIETGGGTLFMDSGPTSVTFTATVVPLPTSALLLLTALAALPFLSRRGMFAA